MSEKDLTAREAEILSLMRAYPALEAQLDRLTAEYQAERSESTKK